MTEHTEQLNPTASKILHAAAHLFMQRGYQAVSINDIARAANITKPTLYYHFIDKEEVFVRMAMQMLAELRERMDAALADRAGTTARLEGLAAALLEQTEGDMLMLRREMQEHLRPEQRDRLARAFFEHLFAPVRREMQAGLDCGDLARHGADELAWWFLGLVEAMHPQPSPAPAPGLAPHTLVDLFLNGASS